MSRRWEDRNYEAEQLAEQTEKLTVSSKKQGKELSELLAKLTTTAEALEHTAKHNEELVATLHSALAANQRMSECIIGQHSLEGTVGIKLQEASPGGLGGDDVSVQTRPGEHLFYVEALREGGSAQISHRIREEDVIVAVNGLPLCHLTLPEAEALLLGEIGTRVTISGRRGLCGSEYIVTLERIKGGEPSDLAAAACSRAKQMQHDLHNLDSLLDLDLGTRKYVREWRLQTVRHRHHKGLLRCLRNRYRRRLLEAHVLMPWHHYARETKRRNHAVGIAAHSRGKTQVFHFLSITQSGIVPTGLIGYFSRAGDAVVSFVGLDKNIHVPVSQSWEADARASPTAAAASIASHMAPLLLRWQGSLNTSLSGCPPVPASNAYPTFCTLAIVVCLFQGACKLPC